MTSVSFRVVSAELASQPTWDDRVVTLQNDVLSERQVTKSWTSDGLWYSYGATYALTPGTKLLVVLIEYPLFQGAPVRTGGEFVVSMDIFPCESTVRI